MLILHLKKKFEYPNFRLTLRYIFEDKNTQGERKKAIDYKKIN